LAAENRLTAEQLESLAPGDTVTIESATDFGRPRHTTGTVARIDAVHIAVRVRGPRGSTFLEQYRRRDGSRVGGLGRAELVNLMAEEAAADARRRTSHIDALYREWARNRADVDRLRRLQEAIADVLKDTPAGVG
jgi:hypothetical protein